MRYEVRELGLGGILDQAVTLTKNHLGLLLGIAAVLEIPLLLVSHVLGNSMTPQPPNPTPADLMVWLQANAGIMMAAVPLAFLNLFVVTPVSNAAMVYGIANAYLDRPVSISETYKLVFRKIGSIVWTWILVFMAILGGMFLCFIPGIIAAFWFGLATQVVVLEGASGVAAMQRSKALMKGNISTLFVLGLLMVIISAMIGGTAALIPNPWLKSLVSIVIQVAASIFGTAAVVVFYFSCRCRHEQFDLALLAQSVGVESAAVETSGNSDRI